MMRKCLKPAVAALVMVAGVAAGQSPALADTLVDLTIAGPIGGAQVCVVTACPPEVLGVANVRIVVTTGTLTLTPPVVTVGSAPGCTANVNKAVFVTTPGVAGAAVTVTVTFDQTDKNGNVVASRTIGPIPVLLPPVPGLTIPLASVCASLL